jgi:hypothetical protein
VDNGPSLYFPLTEDHQPHPSHMAGLQNSHVTGLQNSHVTGLQNSLASLRVSSSNFSSSGEQLSPRNFPNYSLTTPSSFAQSVPLARPPPPSAAGLEPSRQGYAAAAQLEASGLASQQQQHYAHARLLEESSGTTPAAAYGFRRSSLDASAAAAPAAGGYSSSMFGLGDISARIRQEAAAANNRTLLPAAGGEPPVSHPSAATAAAGTTVAHGGWNPLMSGAAPAVLVHPRPQTDHTAGQESVGGASVVDTTAEAADDSASDVNPIEEYIFYSDDDEESSSSSSSTERRPANDDGLQFSSCLQLAAAATGSSVVPSGIKKKKKRSLSSSGKTTGSLLTQRTAASLDADLRPPSPPPFAQLSTAPPTGVGLTKVTSWSQIVGNATKPAAAIPWTAAAVSPAPFVAASPSPQPQQQLRGKSVSPPLLPEFHRGPKVDPRWPVSQQVFLGKRNFCPRAVDPDSLNPDSIRIQGLDDQKLKIKITAENLFLVVLQFTSYLKENIHSMFAHG